MKASRPRLVEAAIVGFGLSATVLLVAIDLRTEREQEGTAFARAAQSRITEISHSQDERLHNDQIVADLFDAAENLSEERFVKFAESHPPAFRRAIEFIPRVRASERATFEEELRRAHAGAPGIWEPGPGGAPRPAEERADYFPVRYMHPAAEMEAVFGFDLGSEPGRRAALEQSARSGRPTLSGPVRLVEDPDRWAYLRYVPLYEQGRPTRTPEQHRDALRGFVVGLYRFGDTLEAALQAAGSRRQVVYLSAQDLPDARPVYVARTAEASPDSPKGPTFAEARALPGAFVAASHTTDQDRFHVFVPSPPPSWWSLGDASTGTIALLGLALTAAAVADRRRTRRMIAAADEAEGRTRLVLDAAPEAIVVLDETGLVLRANARTGTMFGYREEEIVGHPIDALVGEPHRGGRHTPSLLFPRLAEARDGSSSSFDLAGYRKDGREIPVELDVAPFGGGRRPQSIVSIRDVTERKAAAAALEKERALLRTFLDAIPDVAFTKDTEGRYTSANQALVRHVGAESESFVLGKTAPELFPPDYARTIEEEDRRVLGLGEAILDREDAVVDFSGALRRYLSARVPIRSEDGTVSGLVGISRDVTDRHRQERVRGTELEITRILAESTEMEEGVRRALAAIGTRLGWEWGDLALFEGGEALGAPVVVWHDGSAGMTRLAQVSRETVAREKAAVLARVREDREPVWLEEIADSGAARSAAAGDAGIRTGVTLPLFSENRVLGAISLGTRSRRPFEPGTVAVLADAAARVSQFVARTLAQAELQAEHSSLARRIDERTAELRAANVDLARAGRMKDEFLASMSHELRTPLNAILGLSEALQEEVYGPVNEKQAGSLQTIEESGRHLLALINDILDLSKIEAGRLEIVRSRVEVASVCQSALRMVLPAAAKKGITPTLSVEPPDLHVDADLRRLKQILVNLLSNAVKFTGPGGSVALTATGDDRSVTIAVRDTGIGISQGDRPRLFKPFVQLDASLARRHGGSGLGLAIVGRLTELHGGSVQLESEPGQGTTVSVSLPNSAAAAAPQAPD